ncbi:MAG TPA: glycerate kinase [Prolixibacteraceae bacterium]|nr:glycerate kinase [Prolixibacteraceae bacterium]
MKKSPHILIAPDAFKESLAANQVAYFLKKGIEKALPDSIFDVTPVTDGGEGFLKILTEGTGGTFKTVVVHDALMRRGKAEIGFSGDRQTAFIEMAVASGLEMIPSESRNPLVTTTFGTGEMIKHAIEIGCKKIVIGIGGSATNDGGAGMAEALGAKFLDKKGQVLLPGGGQLSELYEIDLSGFEKNLPEIVVACDVSNPLTGPNGASAIYGPQKGATPEMVQQLDAALKHYAEIIRKQFNIDIENIPGAGAAGGLGGGSVAFAGAKLVSGFQLVSEILDLENRIAKADFVITAEGKLDAQTINGKAPFGVAQLAKKHNKPVIGVAGTLGNGYEKLYDSGFDFLISIINQPFSLAQAIENAPKLIEKCGYQIGKIIGFNC